MIIIIGNDVILLFSSLDSTTTGRIVREETMMSTMEIEGFNTRLGLKYIVMNKKYTSDLEPLRRLLPTRMTKPGVQPTMKSKWVNHKEILSDDDWIYPQSGTYREGKKKNSFFVMGWESPTIIFLR